MPHHTPLITMLVVGIVLAFALGMAAHRLRASPLVDYLLAGVLVGPFTPASLLTSGSPANSPTSPSSCSCSRSACTSRPETSLRSEGWRCWAALAEIALLTAFRMALAWAFGWGPGAGLVFGLSLSVASTVVLTRALQERHLPGTERGRTAVGWLVVEDIAVVLTLVLLPPRAGAPGRRGGAVRGGAGLRAPAHGRQGRLLEDMRAEPGTTCDPDAGTGQGGQPACAPRPRRRP